MMTYYQQQLQNMQAQQQTQPTIQDGGIVQVKDETAARNYPTAPGVSITLIDETRQHIFVKTMGFNQLEKPIFKKFLLIPEDEQNGGTDGVLKGDIDNTNNDLKTQIETLQSEYERLKEDICNLYAKFEDKPKKKVNARLAREENEDET
jgi:hypothetical protein